MSDTKVMEELVKEKQALAEAVKELDSQINGYKDLGTPEEIDEALTKAKGIVDKIKKINLATVEEDIKELAEYRSIGSIEQINEAIDKSMEVISVYKELGKPEEINSLLEKTTSVLEQYSVLGKPAEIDKVLDMYQEKIVSSKCEEIGAKWNVDSILVRKMYEKANDFNTVEELLELSFTKNTPKKEESKKALPKKEEKKSVKLTAESKQSSAAGLSKILKNLM